MLQNLTCEQIYKERIKERVSMAVCRGVISLESICRTREGAFPSDVLTAIADLRISLESPFIGNATCEIGRRASSLPAILQL